MRRSRACGKLRDSSPNSGGPRYDFGLDHSWIQNLAHWPINLMMHELAERKIAGGDRAWRKHRGLDVPFGL